MGLPGLRFLNTHTMYMPRPGSRTGCGSRVTSQELVGTR